MINRPIRDALLLHQALTETPKDRAELLISRLIRFHWEPRHLEQVKVAYWERYQTSLERAIVDSTEGDFSDFCVALSKGATV